MGTIRVGAEGLSGTNTARGARPSMVNDRNLMAAALLGPRMPS
jgi:hypothetical protein